MLRVTSIFVQPERKHFVRFAVSVLFRLPWDARQPHFLPKRRQRTFSSAEVPVGHSCCNAGKDEQAPLSILGPAGRMSSRPANREEDLDARVSLVVKYQEMHPWSQRRTELLSDGGAENWPFPIPLVNNHGHMVFDTRRQRRDSISGASAKMELAAWMHPRVRARRQNQLFAHPPANLPNQFAQKLVSDEGRHNGLYWHGASDEFDSPINPLFVTHAKISQPTKLASMFLSMVICFGFSRAKGHMRRAEPRTTSSMA